MTLSFLLFYSLCEVLETGEIIFHSELSKFKINVKNAEDLFNNGIKLLNGDCPDNSCQWREGK